MRPLLAAINTWNIHPLTTQLTATLASCRPGKIPKISANGKFFNDEFPQLRAKNNSATNHDFLRETNKFYGNKFKVPFFLSFYCNIA